jgi:asparagine synthase (glutamine-hydrolysing)
MCGIAGFQGNFEVSLAKRMQSSISHRGPDGEGLWHEPSHNLAIVHTRLAILDLRLAANQPMVDARNGNRIVFNGEIYNFRELRSDLESLGHSFETTSDTEVLLKLYSQFGTDCLSRLNGIFAFAIWDSSQQHLFLARDQFGIKPLYYAETNAGFLFSSEMKSILQYDGLDRTLDRQAVADYLTYLYCPWPRTMLQAVKKLPPATAVLVKHNKITKKWSYYSRPSLSSDQTKDEAEYVGDVRDTLRDCVRRQLVSDVPVGSFLSGGLDSSAIVAIARQELGKSFECFTINDTKENDGFVADLPYAQKVAKLLDVRLNICDVSPDMANLLPKMIYHLDEPQADFAAINVLLISQLARQSNIKVLLSGAGGDDLFTGYRRHYALQSEKYWSWLPKSVRSLMQSGASWLPSSPASLRRLARAFSYAGYDADERLMGYFRWSTDAAIRSILSPDYAGSYDQAPFCSSLRAGLERSQNQDRLARMLDLEMDHFLADHNLNYTDKLGMATGVEIRVPLLDREIVEVAARIPSRFKQRGNIGKYVFKKAMEGLLPNDIIYRKKTGFGVPLRKWLKGPLQPLIDSLLASDTIKSRGIFDFDGMQRLRKMDNEGSVDASYSILAAACIELWCQIFLDGTTSGHT